MPLKVIERNELHSLYDTSFDPFCDLEVNLESTVHQPFEKLRTQCKLPNRYYSLTASGTSSSTQKQNKLLVLHINARSILNNQRFEAFNAFLYFTDTQWDIICISETWLNCDIEKHRTIDGYSAFFASRSDRTGGGAAIYIRNDRVVTCTRLSLGSPVGTESVFVECKLPCSKVIIGQVYRPPNCSPLQSSLNKCHIS